MKRHLGLSVALSVGLAAGAARAEGEAPKAVVERLGPGEVNWTDRTVLATGSGAPDLKQPNVAAVRLKAERTAKVAALRNVLEALKGVRITAKNLAGEQLGVEQVRVQVEGLLQGCKTVDTRYFSDYGVDVVVECPLDGALAALLSPPGAHRVTEAAGDKKFTGLVIDATGTGMKPSLSPKVRRGDKELYSAEVVKPQFLDKHGVAAFYTDLEQAKKAKRVGDKPLVVKAGPGADAGELVLDATEGAKLDGVHLGFLAEGRVVIVSGS